MNDSTWQGHGTELLGDSDTLIEQLQKALLKQANELADKDAKILTGAQFKVTNISVFLGHDGLPVYSFTLTDMEAQLNDEDARRTNEDAYADVQALLGHGLDWYKETGVGVYTARFAAKK